MKLITMSVCLIAMLLTHTVQAQSYNDDHESKYKSVATAMKNFMYVYLDQLEKAIYARLDGETLEGDFATMSIEDMICNYECLYAVKSESLIYYENMELLPIMYEEEELDEASKEIFLDYSTRLKEMDVCACMIDR